MGYMEGDLFGVKARIFRISFSGELAYEVNVCSDNGIFIDDKLLFTRPAFHSPPFQLLIDCELALTGGALDAETHQTGIYRVT